MVENKSISRRVFEVGNYTVLLLVSLLCIFPIVHILAISFSSSSAATAGAVSLWPVEFNTKSYSFVIKEPAFLKSFIITLQRLALGVSLNMVLGVLVAYALSKEVKDFRFRTIYVWIFVITMLFGGGLIPTYMIVMKTGLLNTIWALVLPSAVNVFNVILILNFFRGLPKELLEAAFIDGASHWKTLARVVIPVSMPVLATVTLFAIVFHWNEWFTGLIYMNSPDKYPLQSYLQTVIVNKDFSRLTVADLTLLGKVSDRTVKAAQIFLGTVPILLVYPFLQRYFMSGIVMGSVKE
ncbi:putative ABC transporter permease protein YtcP [Paenibacillus baekrokdamisoli]|uniref:Putative ABC transporter permease protein YtcP n=1 Tax=Paenibacillus baekrokdamisoli TaxID=1712516 RepID=A0A3G9JMK2_9BACL|nr:carbohydrate ABC transporter permease [Paenibacillus baekrokdamisoli]MBB3071913.1 putative aldouronate transport system permease protein [Paenibacillus baekrokdamisoli]BBH24104.1 putative ABC transporter permease protein YtcP [Paenibacillus baekrokdamisoli]